MRPIPDSISTLNFSDLSLQTETQQLQLVQALEFLLSASFRPVVVEPVGPVGTGGGYDDWTGSFGFFGGDQTHVLNGLGGRRRISETGRRVADVLIVHALTGLAMGFVDDLSRWNDLAVPGTTGAVVDGHTGALVPPEESCGTRTADVDASRGAVVR